MRVGLWATVLLVAVAAAAADGPEQQGLHPTKGPKEKELCVGGKIQPKEFSVSGTATRKYRGCRGTECMEQRLVSKFRLTVKVADNDLDVRALVTNNDSPVLKSYYRKAFGKKGLEFVTRVAGHTETPMGCSSFAASDYFTTDACEMMANAKPPRKGLVEDCADCQVMKIAMAGETFLVRVKGGTVKFFIARDVLIQLDHFAIGSSEEPDFVTMRHTVDKAVEYCVPKNSTLRAPPPAGPASAPVKVDEIVAAGGFHPTAYEKSDAPLSTPTVAQSPTVKAGPDGALFVEMDVALDTAAEAGDAKGCVAGDGYCDAQCNTAANNFDGGDCCPGTCLPGRRYPCGYNGFTCTQSMGKTCFFAHGLGNPGPAGMKALAKGANFAVDTTNANIVPGVLSSTYWGDMAAELQGVCQKVIYGWAQTVDFGWDYKPLQKAFADQAAKADVVVAHSMGNMVLAGACMDQNLCPKFIALAPPFRGSKVAVVGKSLLDFFGVSRLKAADSIAYQFRGMRDGPGPKMADVVLQKQQIKRLLCGTRAFGSGGTTGFALAAIREVVWGTYECNKWCLGWHEVPADGLVHIDDCTLPGFTLSSDYTSKAYTFPGNHQDSTGERGNVFHILDFVRAAVMAP